MLPAFYGLEAGLSAPELTLSEVLLSASAFLAVSDDVSADAFSACLEAVEQKQDGHWIASGQDASLAVLTALLRIVVMDNFAALFALKRPEFTPTAVDGPGYRPAGMLNGEEWLWRPVHRGYFKGESLFDGSIRIEHVARANAAIDVADENEIRARKAADSRGAGR